MTKKMTELEFTPRVLKEGEQPPPKNMGGRVKYADTLKMLKEHEGRWVELLTVKKGEKDGPLYARRQTLSSFEGYEAQVRHLPEDHAKNPGGIGLFASFKPKPPKPAKASKEK